MRTEKRPRKYVKRHWLQMMWPLLRFSAARNAYVLRGIGRSYGPVLKVERRGVEEVAFSDRRNTPFTGVERRRTSTA